jgi:hypothetical protein
MRTSRASAAIALSKSGHRGRCQRRSTVATANLADGTLTVEDLCRREPLGGCCNCGSVRHLPERGSRTVGMPANGAARSARHNITRSCGARHGTTLRRGARWQPATANVPDLRGILWARLRATQRFVGTGIQQSVCAESDRQLPGAPARQWRGSNTCGISDFTAGFNAGTGTTITSSRSGCVFLLNPGGNTWLASGTVTNGLVAAGHVQGVAVLSGVLDRLRLTTNGGTNTFDAGSVNIAYEG